MEYKELGLTNNEAKVYEVLLRLGKATAAQASKESGVPYGRIYTVLDSLEEKGLVRIVPEKTKYYYPTDPDKLHNIIDSKIKQLMEIDTNIKNLKKQYDENIQEPVIIAKGKANFYKIAKEMKHAEKYGYTVKYTFELHPEWIKGAKRDIEKGIDIKTLGRFDAETMDAIKEWSNIISPGKPIPNDGIAMSIVDDEQVMIALIKSNTTMLIRDKPFAKMMKELFTKYYINTEYLKIK